MKTVWVELRGKRHEVVLVEDGLASVDGVRIQYTARELQPGVLSLLVTDTGGRTQSFRCIADAGALLIGGERIDFALADPRSLRSLQGTSAAAAGLGGPMPLKAPMPGRVVRVLVADGDTVEAGQGCLVIEAMKMQNELKSPRAGTVGGLKALVGETVAAGAVLLVVA